MNALGRLHALRRRLRPALRRATVLGERSLSEFFEDKCPLVAAAISYYALVSLFPLAIVVVAALGLFIDDTRVRDELIDFIVRNLPLRPGEGRRELREVLGSVTSGSTGFGVLGAVGLTLAASGLIGAVRGAINAAWDAERGRPPLQGKLLDILLVAGVGVVVALSLGLSVLTHVAASLGGELEDALGGLGGTITQIVVTLGRAGSVLINAAVFLFLFRVLPAPQTRVRDVWPGVLIATLGYELARTGFSIYLENFANYGAVYGSLGVVLAFLVFVFLAANVFLLGAEAASEWPSLRAEELDDGGEQRPLRERAVEGLKRLVVRQD